MLPFWAALLGAELRELRDWQTYSTRAMPSVATDGALRVAGGAAAMEASSSKLAVVGSALRTFGWAQIAAGLGVTAALVHLLARRNGSWLPVVALALASILTSSHLFSVARDQLRHPALTEP